jgi:hypothetical protein
VSANAKKLDSLQHLYRIDALSRDQVKRVLEIGWIGNLYLYRIDAKLICRLAGRTQQCGMGDTFPGYRHA